jgi:NAD(P)-dependent dehydrogenase (short-subunit alcohol dehydrogenase family)
VARLTRHVANAYGKQNIRCNALALGMILTDKGRHNMTLPGSTS